jgi:hypothetical protein
MKDLGALLADLIETILVGALFLSGIVIVISYLATHI